MYDLKVSPSFIALLHPQAFKTRAGPQVTHPPAMKLFKQHIPGGFFVEELGRVQDELWAPSG